MAFEFVDLEWVYDAGTPFERIGLSAAPLSLNSNQVVGIIGATGSGKSTFVKLISGLLDGIIRITFNSRILGVKEVSYVFQQPEHQLFEETIDGELEFALKNFNIPEELWPELKSKALANCGLEGLLPNQSPLTLSGGQKRRLAIASVLVYAPRVLILDEPLAGVDASSKKMLIGLMRNYISADTLVLWVSHDHEALLEWADQIILFEKNTIDFHGSVIDGLARCAVGDPIMRKFLSTKLECSTELTSKQLIRELRGKSHGKSISI